MAQSIKIPVELELRQLQGSIQTLKNALEKVKPGTKVYENLSKSLDKIEHQFYSLENASKKSFKNVGEINAFEKAFEKVANSISDVASDFKRLNFEDLSSDLFSKDDIQRIQEASSKIKKVQTDIDNLRSDKFKEVAGSSDEIKKAFSNLEIDIDTTNIDDAIKSIKNNLKSLSNQIGGKTRSINSKKNQLNLLETQAAAISSLKTGEGLTLAQKFGANFFDDTGKAFKDENSKQALVEMLAGLGLNKANLVKVQQSTAEDLDSFSDNIINTLRASAAQMKKDIEKITKTELPALEFDKQQLTSTKAQQEAALKQLTAIDPSLTAELDNYKQQLSEAKNQLVLLKQELAQVRNGTDNYTKVVDDNNNALRQVSGSLENVKEQVSNVARAQEKLADIKFAIKNWFGFNEVINLTKNAVRNMITQIRELDDVMTQIAIVTDMTQQELWDQMDTYSAMAQQYGASIKGVYEVSQLYYQQGLQTAEVMNLTEETLKMAKIANLDYAEATDYMTVALRGFKLEMSDAQQVTDVYSALAAATASDTEELAVAMSKTASSAEAVGSSFESTSAMIATMISITREAPENIGSALKSIISRYGEMTSDPMKLVDSEGEEMSLNKVDKALQSVGISLQNAQGQFRDFDDVILELSKSWDTIDTNTQRYIATVMAGNRQQSRFLALVGNYEEYAKALDVAENAEDAGTLQTLKTMDSISTKWEQLKVSLQEFYTSSGLEDVFKGVLDALNAFLTKANDIPKLFGKIPVSVIALVSSLITSIKNVATSLTTAAIGPIKEFNKKLDELAKKNIEIKVKAVPETGSGTQARQVLENEAKQGGPITTNKNPLFTKEEYSAIDNYFKKGDEKSLQKLKEITGLDDNDIKQLKQELDGLSEAERKALGLSDDFAKKLSNTPSLFDKVKNSIGKLQNSSFGKFFSKNAGSISLVTSALSAYALTIKDAASATVEGSKTISGGLNTIGGLALGIFGGQWQYAIPMLISGIPTLIDGLIYETEEKLKNATEKATELSNTALQSKSDYRTLKNEVSELEALTSARYDSAEAMQEYLDYSNQMADKYPELIDYIDSEGNAVLDLSDKYNVLEQSRLAAAEAAAKSAMAELETSKINVQKENESQVDYLYQNLDIIRSNINDGFATYTEETRDNIDQQFSEIFEKAIGEEAFEKFKEEEIKNLQNLFEAGRGEKFLSQLENDYSTKNLKFKTDYGASDVFADISASIAEGYYGSSGNGTSQTKNLIKDDIEKYASETTKNLLLGALEGVNLDSPEEVNELMNSLLGAESELISLTNITDETGNQLSIDTLNFINSLLEMIPDIKANERAIKLAKSQQQVADNQALSTATYWKGQELLTGDNKSKYRVLEEMSTANKIIDNYLKEKQGNLSFDDYYKDVEKFDVDYTTVIEQLAGLWNNLLTTGKAEELNEIIGDLGSYSENNLREALNNIGVINEGDINLIISSWEENYSNAFENFKKARKEQITKLFESSGKHITGGASLGDLAPKYYSSVLEQFAFINSQVEKNIIEANQGQIYANNLTSLWEKAETDLKFGDLLQQADLTSLTGIYAFKEALIEAGYNISEFDKTINNLASNISINLTTEWQTFGQKVKTGLESFTEALTNATEGMDYEDAINMASKLEMSLSDFRFEDGEYFLDNITAIQESYGNFGDELKQKLKDQTLAEIGALNDIIADASSTTEDITKAEEEKAKLETGMQNALAGVDEYIAYHTNIAYLTAGLYEAFLTAVAGEDSKLNEKELLSAARQGEQALRDYVVKSGEDFEEGYYSALIDSVSSTNDDILSAILDAKVSKGGTAYIGELTENTDLERYTEITAENVGQIFSEMYKGNAEAYNDAMTQYMESRYVDLSGMIAGLADDIENIDYSSITDIATAMGVSVNNIIYLFKNNFDGTFSTSLRGIQALAQRAGVGITSEIQDAINEYFNNILGIVSNGISGSMTNVEFETLTNFMGLNLDFTETAEGLKLTKASAIEVYTELKKIDLIQAQITFSDLAESLEEAGSGYEDVASTMKTIAELNKELANVPVSSERRDELERELAVAEEILRVRSQDPDFFKFMDKDLPTGMQGPENYWNSVGKAYKVMNESAKSGYMEIQDYVNIVNQMESMAIAAGQEFSIGGMNAAQLIEKGMSSLKNIDGEGVKIAMEGVGIDFANAATDMGLSFDDGIKEVAKSQIKMLDAAIRILEAMVALEELDIDGSGMLEMDEIFVDSDPGKGFTRGAKDWLKNINLACGDIKIGGKTLEETMLALAKTDPDKFSDFINQMTNIDWTLGDTNVAAQIESLINTFFPGEVVSMDKSIFDILEVPLDADKNLKDFEDWAKKAGLTIDKAENLHQWLTKGYDIAQGTPYYDAIKNLLGLEKGSKLETEFDNAYSFLTQKGMKTTDIIQLWDEITVSDGTEGTKYTYNGITYDTLDDVLVAKQLKETEGISGEISNTTTNTTTGEITSELSLGQTTITVTQSESGTIYRSADGTCESNDLRKVIDYEVYQKTKETSGISRVEAYAEFGIDLTAEGLANVSISGIKEALSKPIKPTENEFGEPVIQIDGQDITFEAGTTNEQIQQKLMEAIGIDAAQVETIVTAISTAISTANWAPVGEAIANALKTNIGQEENGTEAIEIGELTLKPEGLKVDTSEAGEPTLLNAGEDLTAIPVNSVTLKPINVDIDTSKSSLSESATSGLTISIPENLNADSINLINQFNSAISTAATNATVTSGITVTITGLDDDEISSIENYNSAVKDMPPDGTTSSVTGEVSIDAISLLRIIKLKNAVEALKANPNINSTISAEAEGSALEVVSDIMALYGYDGQTAKLFFEALDPAGTLAAIYDQIDPIIASDDENLKYIAELIKGDIETQLDDLTKDRTINITPTLVNPGNMEDPAYYIGDGTGKAYNTTTYSTYQGAQERLEQLKVEKGELAGDFTVELIDLATSQIDATTLTVTPLDSIDLSATNVTLTANGDNGSNNNNGSDSGQGAGGGGELPILDVSAITSAIQEIGEVSNTAATNINTAIENLTSIDTFPIAQATNRMGALANAVRGIPSSGAGRINSVATAIRNLPSSKTISIGYTVSVNVTGTGVAAGRITHSNADSWGGNSASGILAKGNVALAKGSGNALASGSRKTLMGELGPELVVSGGRYFVVGQSGAEFVDLADDAIVFNHLQTKKLLGSGSAGHGKPVTNEKNATSLATGNVSGPAMASASDALAQLRQIRAMWQAMLDASAKDLGSKAGSGGGGGGGGGGEDVKAVTGELERWYNLLRQIDSLEQHITLEQAKRANMMSGYSYVDSLEKELEMLKEQQAAYGKLAELQKDYYDRRREDLLSTDYSKIFTYTEHGLMQYVDGENRGLDVLAKLNERDATGKLINNAVDAKAQIKYLQNIGFDTSILKNNEDGTEAENEEGMMENFWAGVDGWMEELDGLYDSYHDATISFEESTEKMNEILQEYIDNQLSVEQKLMQAIQDREQAEIDRIQDEKDTLEEAAQSYIDGLNDALSKEQDMYSKNETNAETQKLQRQLAILQRSGGSTSEIKSLQDQIDSRLKNAYFQEQQDQIDAIQEASDNQLEKLQNQIDIMTESLEYQKEHGLLWNEVYEMMNQWTPEQMLQFIEEYTKSYQENSALQNEEDSKETLKELEIYTGKRDQDAIDAAANERNAAWLEYYKSLSQYSDEFKTKHQEAAQKAFNDAYDTGDLAAGKAAADKVFADAKKAEEAAVQAPVEEEETFKGFKAKNNTTAHTLYEKNNRSGKHIGTVAKGEEVTILGKGTKGIVYVENKSGKKGFMKLASLKVLDSGFNFNDLPQYEKGGTIDFTGLAMVHGSKNNPESILSAEHTKLLRQGIFSDSNHSLAATVEAIQELAKNIVSSGGTTETGINIEHLSVEIQPGVISSDYDARRAGEMALEEMVRIARKTTNRVVSR